MIKYLLDSSVINDFVLGDENVLFRMKQVSPSDIAISSLTLMDIHYGIGMNPQHAAEIEPIMTTLLAAISVLNFNQYDAIEAANIRTSFKRQANTIGSYEVLLAGSALHHNLTLVSANPQAYAKIEHLRLENWRADN